MKAVYQALSVEVWGHSVSKFLQQLPEPYRPPRDLVDKAKELNRHYIPMCCPNFRSEGAPLDYYTERDVVRAVAYAEEIVQFCGEVVRARLREGAERPS